MDICCDVFGRNALGPFIFSAFEDSSKQVSSIAGKDIICNPPYGKILMFKLLLDEAFRMNNDTRAYFIVPLKESGPKNDWIR